ncbi:hypothetical protein [Alkaliphilus hydrothermalis]|uniref:Nucleic acid-binding Zn-ribbon protein n=1 Tax=Alkaliphilus hydrothermalis TaxID=1482730 RepID=A0ABS2NM85_9FIRM|nr:hypothetical protein [Alkaliphilus hydrothermalis]MBM7613689.1 putative nucleic acid-binding Zn-ribbon protein [Alkaliphilus hydrothermalis]
MKKFCVQSLIIGIGIGMIMTASFNFLVDDGNEPLAIAAGGLAIVDETGIEKTIGDLKKNLEAGQSSVEGNKDDFIKEEETTESEVENQKDIKENKDNGMQAKKMVENNRGNRKDTQAEMVRIVISSGMNTYNIANLLWQEGLISDTQAFTDLAHEKGYTKIFKAGLREIPRSITVEEILEILIQIPEKTLSN